MLRSPSPKKLNKNDEKLGEWKRVIYSNQIKRFTIICLKASTYIFIFSNRNELQKFINLNFIWKNSNKNCCLCIEFSLPWNSNCFWKNNPKSCVICELSHYFPTPNSWNDFFFLSTEYIYWFSSATEICADFPNTETCKINRKCAALDRASMIM